MRTLLSPFETLRQGSERLSHFPRGHRIGVGTVWKDLCCLSDSCVYEYWGFFELPRLLASLPEREANPTRGSLALFAILWNSLRQIPWPQFAL